MGKCICPKCKSNNVIPIMYGYPASDTIEEAEKGNLKSSRMPQNMVFYGII